MDLLDRFEALLRNIVDGGIMGRLARTVQPAEIARRLANEMEFNVSRGYVGPTGRIAPNAFTVHLSADDFAEYEHSRQSVEAHIAGYLEDFAVRNGLTILGPVEVHLVSDRRQARHTLHIEASVEGIQQVPPPARRPADKPPPAAEKPTAAEKPAALRGDGALLDLTSGTRLPLGEKVVTLGRGVGNAVVASSEYVSRTHAEIRPHDGRFVLRDLGSRNGTFVNGKRLEGERSLEPGDTISLGPEPVGLRYRFEQAGAGAKG